MTRLIRSRRLWIIMLMMTGLWFFMGKLLMELEWNDLDPDSTRVFDVRRDLLDARTGPVLKPYPCMMHQTAIDLEMRLDGPFPIGIGRDTVMEISISSNNLMVDRLYLGPPTRHLALKALPICLNGTQLPNNGDEEASYGYVHVDFVDLAGNRRLSFGGEDAFPILAWRAVRVDWSMVPWVMEGTESLSQIMVTPL
jgi:hypothetical protein